MSYRLIPPDLRAADFWRHAPASLTGDTGVCWRWEGLYFHDDSEKYGTYAQLPAHRVAYFLWHDAQPGRKEVCHTCDHRWCVNPTHLFLGTHRDNALDCMAKGRHRFGTTPKGQSTTKINEVIVRDIRSSGDSIRTLMTRYGLTESWVHKIKSRKAWKHVL